MNTMVNNININECEFAMKPSNDSTILCHCVKSDCMSIMGMNNMPESIKSSKCEENQNCRYKQFVRLYKDYRVQENVINNLNNEIDSLYEKEEKYTNALEQIRQIVEFAIEETLTLGQKNATDKILEIIRGLQDEM